MMAFRSLVAAALALGAAGSISSELPAAEAGGDLKAADVIDALFMGAGRLTPTDGLRACPFAGFWSGFPRGTTVTVRVSTTVSEPAIAAIQQALERVPHATDGTIGAVLELTDDPNPMPNRNEVTLTFHPDPVSQGCPFRRGCIMHSFARPGVFLSGRAVQPPDLPVNAYVHDVVGHGIMGMCHIDGNLIGGAQYSLMSGGPQVVSGAIAVALTPLDTTASKAVYASSLNPGASRDDFVRHRLIGD